MTNRKSSLAKMFAELEAITAEFETGQIDLEAGLPKFKRGLQLAKILKKRLAQLENEIEEIKTEEVKIPKVHT